MKRTIFISSVQKEFASERQRLFTYLFSDPLLGLFFEPFVFENIPAVDQQTEAVYLDKVSKCEIYLGLFGSDYGYENIDGLSPTECEFDEATKQQKTRLIFIKGDSSTVRNPKMGRLIEKVGLELVRKRFNTESELLASVYASLVNYLIEKELIRSGPFDAALSKATFADIDEQKITAFVARAKMVRNFPLSPAASVMETLTHLNLLSDQKLTNAAVLLFGKNPQRFFTTSEVKCAHFHGTETYKPIPSYQVYKGDVFELVDRAVDFVLSKLSLGVGSRDLSTQVPTQYEIPQQVVAEAIVNAIAHRDYNSTGSVQVMLFSDRLEIWNPGTLTSSLTLSKLKTNHASFPPNPLMAEPMYLTGYIERLGTGTRDMVKFCKEADLKEPIFELDEGFRLIIWRPTSEIKEEVVSGHIKLTVASEITVAPEIQRVVMVIGKADSRTEIQETLNLKSPESFRVNYLIPSLELGYIESTMPDVPTSPSQKYKLTAKGKRLRKKLEKARGGS